MVYIAVLEAVPERVASSNLATRTKVMQFVFGGHDLNTYKNRMVLRHF